MYYLNSLLRTSYYSIFSKWSYCTQLCYCKLAYQFFFIRIGQGHMYTCGHTICHMCSLGWDEIFLLKIFFLFSIETKNPHFFNFDPCQVSGALSLWKIPRRQAPFQNKIFQTLLVGRTYNLTQSLLLSFIFLTSEHVKHVKIQHWKRKVLCRNRTLKIHPPFWVVRNFFFFLHDPMWNVIIFQFSAQER